MDRKGWLLVILAAGLIFAFASCAAAQAVIPEDLDLGYTFTAGAALPVAKNLNNHGAPTVGISWYGSAPENLAQGVAIGLSGDWIPITRNDNTTVNLVPLLFNYRQYERLSAYRIFTTVGVGVIGASDNIPEMKLQNGVQFGWTVAAGLDLTNRLFFHARFIGSKNPSDDGMTLVSLGYRF